MRSLAVRLTHAVALTTVAGLAGFALHSPWLFPSLGPTAVVLSQDPHGPWARPRSVLLGHAVGAGSGLAAVWLAGVARAPEALGADGPSLGRVLAANLAMLGTVGLGSLLRAIHPPAAATTLLVALGAIRPDLRGLADIGVGVLLVFLTDLGLRRLGA